MERKILSLIRIGVGLIFALTPFAMFPDISFPLTLPKIVVFQVLTEIVFALWLVLAFSRKEYRPRITSLSAVIFTFLFIVNLSAVFGTDLIKSLWGLMDRGTGLVLLWHLFALFLVIKSLKNHLDFKWFVSINVFTGGAVSIIAVIQRFIFWPESLASVSTARAFAPFANYPFLAGYLIFTFFLGLWLISKTSEKERRWTVIGITTLNFVVIFLTETRGAILGLAAGLLVLLVYYLIKNRNKKKNIIRGGTVLIILVMFSLVFNSFFVGLPGIKRFFSHSLQENLEQREVFWEISWQGFKEKPLLGWGWENFDVVFWKYYDPAKYESRISYIYTNAPDKPFNILFEHLISTGLFGLLSYLSIFVIAFYKLTKYKDKRSSNHFIVALFVAYFVQNLALFDTIATYPLFFALLAFIDKNEEIKKTERDDKKVNSAVLIIILAIILFPLYLINWRTVYAARYHALAYKELGTNQKLEKSLNNWQIALQTPNPYSDNIVYDYAVEMRRAFDKKIKYSAWPLIQKEVIESLKNFIARHPKNIQGYIELGNAYNSFWTFDQSYIKEATSVLDKGLKIAPANAKTYVALAKSSLLQQNRENAYNTLTQAAELHYGLDDPQILLALLYYQIGDKPQSLLEIKNALGEGLTPRYAEEYAVFGDLFADFKDYKRALEMYKGVFENSPLPGTREKSLIVNTSLKVGLIYNLLGETEKSRQALENLGTFLKNEDLVAYQQLLTVLKVLGF